MTITSSSLTQEQKRAQLKHFFEDTPPVGQLLSTLRSRRVAKGYSVDSGKPELRTSSGNSIVQDTSPLSFQSEHEPVPLTEVEEAILAWAACGPNGMVHWDIAVHGGFHELTWIGGRTCASPGNSSSTDLIIIKDEGVFLYKPDQEREAIVEIRARPTTTRSSAGTTSTPRRSSTTAPISTGAHGSPAVPTPAWPGPTSTTSTGRAPPGSCPSSTSATSTSPSC
jgi:hypothetical protein